MAVTLSKIASNTASVVLQVGDDTATVVYFPRQSDRENICQAASILKRQTKTPSWKGSSP